VQRSRTPATVAEPDSTMSNEAGDQMMPADMELVESHTVVDCAADEKNVTETARHDVRDEEEDDMMSSNSGWRSLSVERREGLDATRSRSGRETLTKHNMSQTDGTKYVEPSTSEMGERKGTEYRLGRLSELMSRKRQCRDSQVDAEEPRSGHVAPSSTVTHPPDSVRKKHRPDPLVLPPSSVEHYGYPSWLRSPRVWSGNGPVPYTPPPMLSPARRAPGLFWAAARAQNQPLWSMFRQPSAFTCEFVLSFMETQFNN